MGGVDRPSDTRSPIRASGEIRRCITGSFAVEEIEITTGLGHHPDVDSPDTGPSARGGRRSFDPRFYAEPRRRTNSEDVLTMGIVPLRAIRVFPWR
jgi:hypothetical protein